MKHTFVLDENILYLGIRGTDEKGNADTTTAELLLLILKNSLRKKPMDIVRVTRSAITII